MPQADGNATPMMPVTRHPTGIQGIARFFAKRLASSKQGITRLFLPLSPSFLRA
jgi:hypothetical protein